MPGLPEHVEELLSGAYDGNYDFNRRAFMAALWFVGHGASEDEYVDGVSASGLAVDYRRNDLTKRLRKTYQDAEDKYDPALAGGSAAPGFTEKMTALYAAVESSNRRDKAHTLALIQHAINTGHNPVNASSRQLAAISGRAVPVTARVMSRWQSSLANGLLLRVSYDGEHGHSRLWHIHTCWRPEKGYICTCKDICNPSGDPEARFREWVEPMTPGSELTVTVVAAELSITRPKAKALLVKHTDELFGGGYFQGDARRRTPAKWWRGQPNGHHHDYKHRSQAGS